MVTPNQNTGSSCTTSSEYRGSSVLLVVEAYLLFVVVLLYYCTIVAVVPGAGQDCSPPATGNCVQPGATRGYQGLLPLHFLTFVE